MQKNMASGPLHRQKEAAKTLGVLGGMGPAATADFYQRVINATSVTRDQEHLRVLIHSYPQVPDRTEFLLGYGANPTPILIEMAHDLECWGADLLVIACNTANAFLPQIAASVTIPFVNWAHEAAISLLAYQPGLSKLGLLATSGTISCNLYQQAFAPLGVEIVIPQPSMQQHVMNAIYGFNGVKTGLIDPAMSRDIIQCTHSFFRNARVEGILLACTELSLLFASNTPESDIPIFDASQLVAERVVILAGGRPKQIQQRAMSRLSGNVSQACHPLVLAGTHQNSEFESV